MLLYRWWNMLKFSKQIANKHLMLIAVEIAEAYSVSCQTSKINLFAKVINDCKGEFKTLSNI